MLQHLITRECTMEIGRQYCFIFFMLTSIHTLYVHVIARAGVMFGIYFTSCRYSGG